MRPLFNAFLATSLFALSACGKADVAASEVDATTPAAQKNATPQNKAKTTLGGTNGLSVAIGDAPAAPINYTLAELATGLVHPSSIAFLPSGEILLAERDGRLRLVRDNTLIEAPISGLPEIHVQRQAGLHDVVLHPNFSENNLIYFSYSHGIARKNATRLARAKLVMNDTSAALEDLEVLFTRIPWSDTSHHYGGRIAFLSDGTLLLTVGEASRYKEKAVQLDNHYGKVVRLNDDGSIPADNPFIGQEGVMPEIYSYGHRNAQGLIITADDTVISHEHGPKGGDEVNIVRAGANYGWPVITYGVDYSGAVISPYSERDGMEQSIVHYEPSIAPSGFTMYNGEMFPDWQGDLFIGALAHKHVRRINVIDDGSFGAQEELFGELDARIRDVRTGPDGAIYFVTDSQSGSLYRASAK